MKPVPSPKKIKQCSEGCREDREYSTSGCLSPGMPPVLLFFFPAVLVGILSLTGHSCPLFSWEDPVCCTHKAPSAASTQVSKDYGSWH
jgi:hypothetical protein